MFSKGEAVLYRSGGICVIDRTETKDFNGTPVPYYVLKPVYHPESTLFVPVSSKVLTRQMRRVLTREEILSIIDDMHNCQTEWIPDENERKNSYYEILNSGDRQKLASLAKTLYSHQQSQLAAGRRMHQCDEKLLAEVNRLICEEFSYVLGIGMDDVLPFIVRRIGPL